MNMTDITLEDVLKEVRDAQKRAATATFLEAKKEAADTTYPLVEMVVEFFGGRLVAMEQALNEVIEQTESFIQPELMAQIEATLTIGKQLADYVLKMRTGTLDANTLTRLKQTAKAYNQSAEDTMGAVAAVAVEPPGEEEEVDEGEEEEVDEGEEEDAQTPAELPPAPTAAPANAEPAPTADSVAKEGL